MRFAFASTVVLACVSVGCGAGLNQSNGAKMGEALAFAAVAGAVDAIWIRMP